MQPLNLPTFNYKLRRLGEHYAIFDIVRKKYVRLTPEEWVRQHLVHYLIHHLAYPPTLLSLERSTRCSHQLQHRPDLVIYDRSVKPLMLVECKAPTISLNTTTFSQIARYNAQLKAKLLLVSNGLIHLCWEIDYLTAMPTLLPHIPYFNSL
jgi:hypothetical protein